MISRHDHYPRAAADRRRRICHAAAALDADWRAEDEAEDGLFAAIDAVASLPPAEATRRLMPWLADTRWLSARMTAATAMLGAEPFARPPLRIVGGGTGTGGIVLAERGAVRLTLRLYPVEAAAAPTTALFVPGHAALRILAPGGAELRCHHVAVSEAEEAGAFTAATASPCRSDALRPLVPGETLCFDTARTSFTIERQRGDLLMLELAVQPPSRLPIRAYDIATGRLVHVAASRRDSSFRQMALALLRTLGRPDAAPLFVAETRADDFAARWNAMRELIALDPAAARLHLAAMAASDPHPEVRAAAAATAAMLQPREAA